MRLLLLLLFPLLAYGSCIPGLPPGPGHESPRFRLPALHAEPDPVQGGRIVDALGREVLLRGVNVNALVEYWAYDPARFTTYPLTPGDADAIAGIGWNAVRLALSWSRIEPRPGDYDERHLAEVEDAIRLLESRGIYTLVDLHQDAYGPHLAARPGEACPPGSEPSFGWDGAPAWATRDGGQPRCFFFGSRELSPAVQAAFQAFWDDAPGPDEVGIRTRYVAMLRHLATRLARHDAVIGWDVMNEPNVFAPQEAAYADFLGDALAALRAGERAARAPRRLFLFEPAPTWANFGLPPPDFARDDQIVYAPHLYQGGLNDQPLDAAVFELARTQAAAFGGAPVLSGEWGADPRRASDPQDGYFERHQALQDAYRFGATLWTWREACGDPHKAGDVRAGRVPYVWGLFEVDCTRDAVLGPRADLVAALRRPLLRAAPGAIGAVAWDAAARRFSASGAAAKTGQSFVLFLPAPPRDPVLRTSGLMGVHATPTYGGGTLVSGWAEGGAWELEAELP